MEYHGNGRGSDCVGCENKACPKAIKADTEKVVAEVAANMGKIATGQDMNKLHSGSSDCGGGGCD